VGERDDESFAIVTSATNGHNSREWG